MCFWQSERSPCRCRLAGRTLLSNAIRSAILVINVRLCQAWGGGERRRSGESRGARDLKSEISDLKSQVPRPRALAPIPFNEAFCRLPQPHMQSESRESWRAGDVSPPVLGLSQSMTGKLTHPARPLNGIGPSPDDRFRCPPHLAPLIRGTPGSRKLVPMGRRSSGGRSIAISTWSPLGNDGSGAVESCLVP